MQLLCGLVDDHSPPIASLDPVRRQKDKNGKVDELQGLRAHTSHGEQQQTDITIAATQDQKQVKRNHDVPY